MHENAMEIWKQSETSNGYDTIALEPKWLKVALEPKWSKVALEPKWL